MIAITLSVCVVISIMILLMFLVLKRTVKMVNDSSKKYFINTIKEYDEMIDKKNEKLSEINKKIENDKKTTEINEKYIQKEETYIDMKTPSYIDENFFENYKKVNETFNIDKEKIIKNFIEKHVNQSDANYNKIYVELKKKLDFDTTYKLINMKDDEKQEYIIKNFTETEKKIVEEYKNKYKKIDIAKFKTYIDLQIDKTSPIIYIKVGNKYENYDKINPNIKTIYDEKVYTGILIIYKSKIYDYSLGWR
jgi:hypothetical protein